MYLSNLAQLTPVSPSRSTERSSAVLERPPSEDPIDWLPIGLMLVNGQGQVLRANARVREILQERPGLLVRNGHLRFDSPRGTAELQSLLKRAAAAEPSRRSRAVGMLVGHGIDKGGLVIAARRISSKTRNAVVLLLVENRDRTISLDAGLIRDVFGLTPRQTTLALLLTGGCTVNEAANSMRISRNSARTHLREIFRHLKLKKQNDLVRLLLRTLLLASDL